jgi:myo-inositol-1(or 4)-monophosphatase
MPDWHRLPFRSFEHLDEYVCMFKSITEHTAGIRRPGRRASILLLCRCRTARRLGKSACPPWDMAAGSLLILEAGGLVSNFNGEPGFLEDGRIVRGAPKIFPQGETVQQVHRGPA